MRLVSLGPSEAELRPRHAAVHVFDVLTLPLQVIGCVVRARHKYLDKHKELTTVGHRLSASILQSLSFNYLILFSIIVWNEPVTDGHKSKQ